VAVQRTPEGLVRRLESAIRIVPDFPELGVRFEDITPILADRRLFAEVIEAMTERFAGTIDLVAAIEARGFLLGAPAALRLRAGLIPMRKSGKLPGPVISEDYVLEYATSSLEVHVGSIPAGARVLVVDDVIATGGTAAAAATLIEREGGVVVGISALLELGALGGRAALAGRELTTLARH
jgi:adenine phosphoribosyltransferase